MSLNLNLAHAEAANRHVKKHLTVGAINKWSDVLSSGGASVLCVAAMRSVKIGAPVGTVPHFIVTDAAKAEKTGCGNCGEQAAMAFMFLYNRQIRPLDFMHHVGGDHAFVVIGRAAGSDAADHTTWGTDAVVCDPWDGLQAYAAALIPERMYKNHRNFGTSYRAD